MLPSHAWYGVVPGWLIFYAMIAVAGALFTRRAWFVAVLVIVTTTPTITAPLVSAAEPVISALFCAKAGAAAEAIIRDNALKQFHPDISPPCWWDAIMALWEKSIGGFWLGFWLLESTGAKVFLSMLLNLRIDRETEWR